LKNQSRIVIVGGGVMGVGLLYHLALEGCSDVMLIEKGELTSGSTWHAAGQCPSLIGNYTMAKIHHHGNLLYPKLEELTGQYVSWHGSGGIRLARTQHDLDWFQYMRGIARQVGFRMEIIDPAEIRRLNPLMNTAGVLAGAWTMDDGHADPSGLTHAMAKGATTLGATIVRHNRVTDIRPLPSGEWEVLTEKGNITAEIVVNAAGCYAREVGKMVGLDLPIMNLQHHYVVTGPVPEFIASDSEIPVIRDPRASAYIRQEQKSGLIGIYEHEKVTEAWAPRGFPSWDSDSELFEADLDRLMPWLGNAMERLPVLEDAGIKRIVNGAIPHTPDGPPLLGPVAGLKNFWLCCGSSIGVAQGAGCGKYLAQWMLYGDSELNMTALDPRRFGIYADESYMRAKCLQEYRMMYHTPLPGEEFPAARDCRQSALHGRLSQKGAMHGQTNGWERPKWFSTDGSEENYDYRHNNAFAAVREECLAVRERAGLLDLSGFSKYEVSGPDAGVFLNRICANRMPAKAGGIVLAHLLSPGGRIRGEMTITRLPDDSNGQRYYLLSAAAAEVRDMDHLQEGKHADERVTIRNITEQKGTLVLAGPKAREILAPLTQAALTNEEFPWLSGREITVAGIPLIALRVNYVGELGWELHPRMEQLGELYDALWRAGEPHGVANFGLYAMNSLRMEKAYRGWGAELTNEVNMLNSAMERFIKFDKEDFVGKAASLEQKAKDSAIQLVYFEFDGGDSDVRGGEPIFDGKTCVGVTTSGGFGHYTGKALGFGYVDPAHANPGCQFTVELLGESRTATVLQHAVYDPTNLRLRA
jgi:dimethylglycine dehydrogenase